MKIGIDARLIEETGVGRYVRNLIKHLADIDTNNKYIVFLPKAVFDTYVLPNERWEKRLVNIRWHSLREQLELPFIFQREHLDLLHVPYFTVPLLYPGKVITTVHDITILHSRTGKATTLPYPLYFLKWLAYVYILKAGIHKSIKILTVSQAVKKDIVTHLHVPEEKIIVTYEGVDPIFEKKVESKKIIESPYFLYVGNVYPHKQAELILDGYRILKQKWYQSSPIPELIFVGKKDFFYERLEKSFQTSAINGVRFLHSVSDEDLKSLYSGATVLLFPSKNEGFGLPSLEALSFGCPVAVSDIPVFHELLESCATYVQSTAEAWADVMYKYATHQLKSIEIEKISKLLERFSWKNLAEETKLAYEKSISI